MMLSVGAGPYFLLTILNVSSTLNHLMMSSPFKMTCTTWLLGVLAISHLSFNPSKSNHMSFNQNIRTSYNIRGNPINTTHCHRDLGVIISDDLNWNIHHDAIITKAHGTLGLV